MADPTLFDYARRAFSFRPFGMPLPPNWFFLGAIGLLSLREPAFLFLGAGVELAYLASMVSHPRFRGLVAREMRTTPDPAALVRQAVGRLQPAARRRYQALEERCLAVLESEVAGNDVSVDHHGDALGGLMQVYLQLLAAREGVERLVNEADKSVESRLADARLRAESATGALASSLAGQIDVLSKRLDGQIAAANKLAYVDGELQRVEDQVELLREQVLLDAGHTAVGGRIDAISGALSQTRAWLANERELLGPEELAPAPVLRARAAAQKMARRTSS